MVYADGLENRFSNDSILWYSFFKEGTIDFGKSETKAEPCKIYYIQNDDGRIISVKKCPEQATVTSLN